MQHLPRVKFNASLAANGDIIPGAATNGFLADALGVLCHVLIENPTTFAWEICQYDPSQASGSRKTTLYSSAGALSAPQSGLVASFVAHPNAYVLSSHPSGTASAPTAASARATVIGPGAITEANSIDSLNVCGLIQDPSPESVVVGAGQVKGRRAVAIGFEAYAKEVFNSGSYNTYSREGSVAIGYRAESTTGGEVSLGSANIPHMSGVPIMTNPPSAGGTFTFRAVTTYDSGFQLVDVVTEGPFLPGDGGGGGNDFGNWVLHVQGTIVARATDPDNHKVVKVEWVTGGALSQTVMTNGANNISLGLALASGQLEATVAATAGLTLSGYLHITKITW